MRSRLLLLGSSLLLAACGARSALSLGDAASGAGGSTGSGGPGSSSASSSGGPVACPASAPALANPCPEIGQVCTYVHDPSVPCVDAVADALTAFRCEDGGWLEAARCIEASACPAMPPAEGSPCPQLGLDCFYPTLGCSPDGVVQCVSTWTRVNGCPRAFPSACVLTPTHDADVFAIAHPSGQVDIPAVALAGTQLMLATVIDAGEDTEHAVHGKVIQTAVPGPVPTFVPTDADLIGRDAVSVPVLDFHGTSFLLAWTANDGWPNTTTHTPGLFARVLPLHGEPSPDVLIDPLALGPTALAAGPGGAWLGFATPAASDPTKRAASVIALDASAAPRPMSLHLLADETVSGPSAPPIPRATARVVRSGKGYVIAAPTIAAGDELDDSGILIWFQGDPSAVTLPPPVRLAIGAPVVLSLTALRDGSALVAVVPKGGPSCPHFHLWKVNASGSSTELPPPPCDGTNATTRVTVAPFDDGFAMAWTTYLPTGPGGSGGTLHAAVRDAAGNPPVIAADFTLPVLGLTPGNVVAFAVSSIDRSLHLVWSPSSVPGLSKAHRQRLVCATSAGGEW